MTTGITVDTAGSGPPMLLVHGGASPATTWRGAEPLARRFTVHTAFRRGYPPSPEPPHGHQDFEVDAADLLPLLERDRPHVVAHSYGGLGATLAAARAPASVRSLTVLEPPIYADPDDPAIVDFRILGDTVLADGLETDPALLRRFLRISGAGDVGDGPLPDAVAAGVRRAHRGRPPSEARPDLGALRAAGVPALVLSGGHEPALERLCDLLAAALGAERDVLPGAGHFIAAAPGFCARVERFAAAQPAAG